jgi:hypothetical protein
VDLANLIAQLASVNSGLETMARQDARAREQATIELPPCLPLVRQVEPRKLASRRA